MRRVHLFLLILLLLGGSSQAMERTLTGLKYEVSQIAPDFDFTKKESIYGDSGELLTDGRFANVTDLKSGWVGFMRAEGREITIDLEHELNIVSVQARFLHNPSMGILMPKEIEVSVSNNKLDFYSLGKVRSRRELFEKGPFAEEYLFDFKTVLSDFDSIEARYLKITFLTDVWTFIDEIQVRVNDEVPSATLEQLDLTKEKQTEDEFLVETPLANTKASGYMNHMVLIYSGDNYSWNKLDFLPYVGYINSETFSLEDYLFDGFLFLPYGTTSDGFSFGHAGDKPSSKLQWQAYLDRLFTEERNLYALDAAVEVLKESLGDPEYKVKVEIAIPYPSYKQRRFGEIDGELLNFAIQDEETALKNRVKAVRWYVEYALERFRQAKLTNLDLVAFYWFEENISYSSTSYEGRLVKEVADIVHEKDLAFHWIPFVQAEGFRQWQEFGFDLAIMQPNYFFHPDAKTDRLDNNANLAKRYGMSVEIEVGHKIFTSDEYQRRFYDYLKNAKEYGFNNSLLGYYQDTSLFAQAALSSKPEHREIYDRLYSFVRKGEVFE